MQGNAKEKITIRCNNCKWTHGEGREEEKERGGDFQGDRCQTPTHCAGADAVLHFGEQLRSEHTPKARAEGVGQARRRVPVEAQAAASLARGPQPALERGLEPVAEGSEVGLGRAAGEQPLGDGAGRPEPGDQQGALRARAPAAFVARPVQELRQGRAAAAAVQRADALGRVKLVARDGQEVDSEGFRVDRDFAQALRRVGVECNGRGAFRARRFQHSRDLRDGVDGANLVVGVHDRAQDRGWLDSSGDGSGVDRAQRIHGHERGLEALAFEILDGLEHGIVLVRGYDDVVTVASLARSERNTPQASVDGFSAAGHEHKLICIGVH